MQGYRTIIFNLIMTALMVFHAFKPEVEVPAAEQVAGHLDAIMLGLTFFWGIGNLIMRAITKTPVFNRK